MYSPSEVLWACSKPCSPIRNSSVTFSFNGFQLSPLFRFSGWGQMVYFTSPSLGRLKSRPFSNSYFLPSVLPELLFFFFSTYGTEEQICIPIPFKLSSMLSFSYKMILCKVVQQKPSFNLFHSCLIKLSALKYPQKCKICKLSKPNLLWLILLVTLVDVQTGIYLLIRCSCNYFCVVLHASVNTWEYNLRSFLKSTCHVWISKALKCSVLMCGLWWSDCL